MSRGPPSGLSRLFGPRLGLTSPGFGRSGFVISKLLGGNALLHSFAKLSTQPTGLRHPRSGHKSMALVHPRVASTRKAGPDGDTSD